MSAQILLEEFRAWWQQPDTEAARADLMAASEWKAVEVPFDIGVHMMRVPINHPEYTVTQFPPDPGVRLVRFRIINSEAFSSDFKTRLFQELGVLIDSADRYQISNLNSRMIRSGLSQYCQSVLDWYFKLLPENLEWLRHEYRPDKLALRVADYEDMIVLTLGFFKETRPSSFTEIAPRLSFPANPSFGGTTNHAARC